MAANQRQQTKESDLQHRQGVGFEMMVSKQAKKERKKERKADQNNGKETGKGRWLIQKECGVGARLRRTRKAGSHKRQASEEQKRKRKKDFVGPRCFLLFSFPNSSVPPPPPSRLPLPKEARPPPPPPVHVFSPVLAVLRCAWGGELGCVCVQWKAKATAEF